MLEVPRGPHSAGIRPFFALALLTALGTLTTTASTQEESDGGGIQFGAEDEAQQVLIVPFWGQFDLDAVTKRLEWIDSQIQRHEGIGCVIFEIDADSNEYAAYTRLAEYIADRGGPMRGKRTVAYIPSPGSEGKNFEGKKIKSLGQAFGAAVLPVIACNDIALGTNTSFGAGDNGDPMLEDEERDTVARAAEKLARQRGRHGLLARLMVEKSSQRIYKLKRRGDNIKGPERYAFWTQNDLNQDTSDRQLKYLRETRYLDEGRYVTLDAKSAHDFGWADYRGISHDAKEYSELRQNLGLHGSPKDIIHFDRGGLESTNVSWQTVIDVLNHPAMRFFLILFGFLGIFLEIKMFGTMIPGVIGLLCFAAFFVGGMFSTSAGGVSLPPTTHWFEAVLFAIGLLLVACEFLLLPGVGIFGISGCVVCLVSLVLAMVPPGGGGEMDVQDAITTLAAGFGGSGLGFMLLLKFLPKSRWLSRGIVSRARIEGLPGADSSDESRLDSGWMLGKIGTAQTPLRPAGKVLLESGNLLDVVADGEFIAKGERVVVRSCSSTRIVVSRSTEPA
jgi:hypothetical protein